MKSTLKAVLVAVVILSMIAVAIPATAVKPTWSANAPTSSTTGSVSGRITAASANASVGLSGAYVAIVNALNTSEEWYNTTSFANGQYQITGVSVTGSGVAPYRLYANLSPYGEGFSNNFTVEDSISTATANIVIIPQAAKIVLTPDRNNVQADGADTTNLNAYVTDALGNPVADGTLVNFSINTTVGSVTYTYDAGTATWNVDGMNGSLAAPKGTAPYLTQAVGNVPTKGGYAKVPFGWVNESAAGNNQTIDAWVTKDSTIRANTSIYFNPTYASWFGSVQDSFGKPYSGTTITLRLMGYNTSTGIPYEVYNVTGLAQDLPYAGAYTIDNIILYSNISYAFAEANASYQDGVYITGRSNNYSLNKSKTSSGFIVLHVPLPDAIDVVANPDTILVGGEKSIISAQLYLNGKPYKRQGIPVTFYSDNDTVGYLETTRTNVTDANGKAYINLYSNMTKGDVIVTGFAKVTVLSNLSDSATVKVVGWGTISGMVTDKNKYGVPNATVTLWNINFTGSTVNNPVRNNVDKYDTPENPQSTVSRSEIAAIGTYTYYRIKSGYYNVTAEKDGKMWFAWVNLTEGTATNNIAIPDLIVTTPTIPSPTPAPTVAPTATAAPTAIPATPTPTPTPSPGFETVFALAGLLGVAYLIARKEN